MSERFWLLESAEEKRVQGYTGRPSHMEKEGWTILAELPKSFANERPADLDIATTTDELGFEQVVVTLNEKKKSERLSRETSEREAREQKESQRTQRKQAEVQKLKSKELTDSEKLDVLWKLAGMDKGVDEAEAEDSKGKERP